ncbi:MAG: DMT family transporter [Patescibacteria group bacterium]
MNKGILLVFCTAIISGFSIFINRFGVATTNPYVFTGLKNIIVAVLICAVLLITKDWKLLKALNIKQWKTLVIIGLIGGSIPFLLFFKGLSLTTSAQGSFLHKTMFIYVIILAALFLKEKINKKLLIGGLFLLIGSAYILRYIPHSLGIGDLFIVLAVLFWAIENIISKKLLNELSYRIVSWGRMFFGSIFIMIFLIITGQASLMVSLNSGQIIWTLITSILLFGYVMTWYSGLKSVPVSLASTILLLGAPITTLLSFLYTGAVGKQEIIGVFLAALGLITILSLVRKIKIEKHNLCKDLN